MRNRRNPVDGVPVDNDPLTMAAGMAGVWGDPSQAQVPPDDPGARLPAEGFDYSNGVILGNPGPDAANVYAPPAHPRLIPATTNEPRAFQVPHEATHRRFEPPLLVPIKQNSAGFSLLAPAPPGTHYIKLLGLVVTLDAAGTIKFMSGPGTGTAEVDLTGPSIAMGGGAAPQLILPVTTTTEPWLWTAPGLALSIFTVTGKAQGWAIYCLSPYDS